jgi:outer membrane protein assembly factor BamB
MRVSSSTALSLSVALGSLLGPARGGGAAEPVGRLRWLVELGAESVVASPPPAGFPTVRIAVSVPGATYLFDLGGDGSLRKQRRLAADAAAPHGMAAAASGVAVADRQGMVSFWSLPAGAEPSLRWRQDALDRVASVGWDGGERVLIATWKGRLLALAASDGRPLWSVDIGGKAEGPAVVDGDDVYVATKAKTLIRLAAATGVVRWRAGLPGVALHAPSALGAKPRLVLCGTWDGQLLAHDAATGRVRWAAVLPAKLAGAPVASDELVAAVTADGGVHAYDPSGVLRWTAPGSAEGPATLLLQRSDGAASRLLAVSKALVGLDMSTGARLADYPGAAVAALQRRFADAMLEGVKTYSEAEKRALLEREAFEIPGRLFGPPQLVGPRLAFGAEDGWAYVFDAAALRPLARHRAGQPVAGSPRLAAGRVVAVAGEEVHGLDLLTGKTVWTRVLGAEPERIAGDALLGIVAGGRVHAVAGADGDLKWSQRGGFRSATPPTDAAADSRVPWLVDDGLGSLRALQPPGRLVGDPLPTAGELLAVAASGPRSWLAVTRDGSVARVVWEEAATGDGEGRLVKSSESTVGEPLAELHVAGGRAVLRSEAGSLVGLDATTLQEGYRIRIGRQERLQIVGDAGVVVVLGGEELRVHDSVSGELKLQRNVPAPAVGADLRGGALVWLDRWGGLHRAERDTVDTTDLGTALAAATPVEGGFLVVTAAGEVGLVELPERGPAATGPGHAFH